MACDSIEVKHAYIVTSSKIDVVLEVYCETIDASIFVSTCIDTANNHAKRRLKCKPKGTKEDDLWREIS